MIPLCIQPPPPLPLILRPSLPFQPLPHLRPFHAISASSSGANFPVANIDMIRGRDGSWSACQQQVIVLWDLDNKPPRQQPYSAALSLRRLAELFGPVADISAFANRHAFLHLPQWVRQTRRERRCLDGLERRGIVVPDEPYICGVCGRKCCTRPDLKRHFVQLHLRERNKKLSRMSSLKGKKRQKYRERFVSGNQKYAETARELLTPKRGYGLASELRRAGVFVKMVEDKPQAADSAVKSRMQRSLSRGIDCVVLVSDDSDFAGMIGRAKEGGLRTVVIGDCRKVLGRISDFWLSWRCVEDGEVGEEELLLGRNSGFEDGEGLEDNDSVYSSATFWSDGDEVDEFTYFSDFDRLADEAVVKVSAFSEEEMWVGEDEMESWDYNF